MSADLVQNAVLNFAVKHLESFGKELAEALPTDQKTKLDELLASYKGKVKASFVSAAQGKGKRKRGAAAQEGGAAPAKRPLSAYNLFMREKMKDLTSQNPGLSKSEIMKKVAALWKESRPPAAPVAAPAAK